MKARIKEALHGVISAMPPNARRLIAMTTTRTLLPPDRQALAATIAPGEFLSRFFERFAVDCVFDVGANRGQFATMVRQEMQFRGPIISFEPIPALAEGLRSLARSDPDWYIEEVALDSEVGMRSFNLMADDEFSSLLDPSDTEASHFAAHNRVDQRIEVRTSTLDVAFRDYHKRLNFKRPFLKIDTQGNDLAVAEGAADALARFAGLQTEVCFKEMYKNSADFFQAVRFYRERGFDLSNLLPNNQGWFPYLLEIDAVMFNTTMV